MRLVIITGAQITDGAARAAQTAWADFSSWKASP
jgi:hypothetical protein